LNFSKVASISLILVELLTIKVQLCTSIRSNLYKVVTFGTKNKWPYQTGDLLKRFNSYKIFYDRTRKSWPFNTGDYLIAVTTWAGLTTCTLIIRFRRWVHECSLMPS